MSEKPVHQTPSRVALCIALTMAAVGAPPAQSEIWRCGNSYSDRPCGGGRAVEASDARSPDQQRDARRGAQDNAVAAKELERQRLRALAAQPAAVLIGAPSVSPAKPARTDQKAKKAKREESERFVARDPLATPKKKSSKKASSVAAAAP